MLMYRSVEGLTQMTAVGLGLPADTFKDAGKYGYDSLPPLF
jgi:hypothetical protein